MSRDLISSSSYPLSDTNPSSSMKSSQSRIPVKAKRAPLGERVENYDHTTPRQHLVKSVKSVIRPRITSAKSIASPSKSSTYRPSPRAAVQESPSSSIVSSPAGANVSRPGHTPHPRRSSVGLAFLGHDVSMLMDTTRPDFVSDTDDSEGDEPSNNLLVRRGVMGPGRLMTPANSQESRPNSQEHALKEPSPRRLAIRLPTPPASQSSTDVEETISRTLIRPRPAPTPPRRSPGPSILLNGMASPTQDISPNPRRKKSPRVDEAGPSQLRSPFEIATATAAASPRHPRDRVEIVIGLPSRKSVSPSTTPKASKPRKSRAATKTPAAHPLSQSTTSQPSRVRKAPVTAPQPNRRRSTPTVHKPSPPRTTAKPKFAKTPKRLSVPGRGRARKSVTPAELKAMIGLLPKPVEQGSPSDDPLLLVSDDEDTRRTPVVRPSSHSEKNAASRSAARVIDFDAAIRGRSSGERLVARDYEVPIHGSEPDYDVAQDYGFDSGGSDDEDMGNDTFVNVAGARAKMMTLGSLADRQEETTLADEDDSRASSRSNSPSVSHGSEVRLSSPALSLRAADLEEEASPRLISSPANASVVSPTQSVAASLPSPYLSRSVGSPMFNRSITATPVIHSHGLPSPPPSSPMQTMTMEQDTASSPRHARSMTGTPRPTVAVNRELETATAPASPAYSEKFSVGMPSAPSSPLSTRSRDRSATPRVHIEQFLAASSQEVEEEEVQDSWNASPLLLPGTPSALGLFMPEEAGGMSTPYSHIGAEPDTPAPSFDTPTRSTIQMNSPAPAVEALASPTVLYSPVASQSRSSFAQAASPARIIASQVLSPARSSQFGSPARSVASQMGSSAPLSPSQVGSPIQTVALEAASPARSTTSQTAELPAGYSQSPRRSPVYLPLEMDQSGESPVVHANSPRKSPVCRPSEVVQEQPLPVVYTHSPKRSPLSYTQSPRRSPVCLPADVDNDDEEEAEDKENMAPVQSTTPVLSPPTLKSTPPMYAFTFSPRIASPLRIAHNQASTPRRDSIARTSQSPIPAIESLHERFAEVDECPSADVTLEGNSADWSLSDEGLPEMDREEYGLGLDLQGEDRAKEDENLSGSSSSAEEDEVHQEEEESDLVDSSIEQDDDLAEPTFQLENDMVDSDPEEEEGEVNAESLEEDEEQEANMIAPIPTLLDEQPVAEEGESTDSEEAPPSDEEQDEQEAADEHEAAQEQLEEDIPAPPAPVKIVLKLINRGIVKIEPPTSPVRAEEQTDLSVVRSTTPAYDPPQPMVVAPVALSPAPVVSTLYPALPSTPVTTPTLPLVSTTPLGTPPTRQRSAAPQQRSLPHSSDSSSLQAGPSTRPRSRLSRQIADSPEQEESDSIRVRTPRSLGLELEDADADNSMRSVVEVSSLDPKAAARAAAILKLNHAYIEHGDISKLGESTAARHQSMHSTRLSQLDASRREDKTELLYEAELEIVSTRRSRSRSMSRFRGISEAPTELPLPGAWNGTPKRKRSAHLQIEPPKTSNTWGVSQWKKLEKVFRAEREIWVTERNVKAMPGGFIGWARVSTFGPPAAVAVPWDPTRVVDRFLEEQGISEKEQVGDWAREILYTRVEALERHAEHRKIKETSQEERSPKKPKTTPAPPSTVRKLFGWAMPSATKSAIPISTGESVKTIEKGKGKVKEAGQTFKDRLEALQDQPMTQLSESVSIIRPLPITSSTPDMVPPHPSSPAWKNASRPIPAAYASSSTTTRPTPRTLSAILAESSSSATLTRGQLHTSLSQRSAALDALFSGSTSTSTRPVVQIRRSSSVKDIVRGFEDSGALAKSTGEEGLRRVQSRPL